MDLAGWDTFMSKPDSAWDVPGMSRDAQGNYLDVVGRNRDPLGVFRVEPADGRPAVHISGQGFGVMTTRESFENFHLRLQIKWGGKRWGKKANLPRDSGLLYYGQGDEGAVDGNWPHSVEMQIQEHDTGDLFALGTQITVRARVMPAAPRPLYIYDARGEPTTFAQKPPIGNRCVKLEDREKPNGEWNTLELVVLGDESIHVVNGAVVNASGDGPAPRRDADRSAHRRAHQPADRRGRGLLPRRRDPPDPRGSRDLPRAPATMITNGSLPSTASGYRAVAVPSAVRGVGPLDVLEMHLRSALDGEGVDLPMLSAIVRASAPGDIASIVRRRTTGAFARRLWYLYEWLTGLKLDVPGSEGRLRFVAVLDPNRQMALKTGTPSGRHRVIDNLPGTPRFCPMVRWTPALRAASAKGWDVRAREVIASTHHARRPWVATWLQRSDAGSSFVLAGEEASTRRTAGWAEAIGQAGARVLTLNELLRLQRVAYGDQPSVVLGLRRGPAADGGARAEDLDSLVGGVIDYAQRAVCGGVDPVIAAAALAFGFAYIRPFVTGNGHLHRWLVHHTFDAAVYTLPGFVLPISTAMVRRVEEYRGVFKPYPSSRRPTGDVYRFGDMTRHAEFLYRCLEDSIETDLPHGASLAAVRAR